MSSSAASALDFSGPERPGAAGWKPRTLLDLIVGYGLILLVIWTPAPLRSVLYFVTLGWIGYTTWISFSGWDAMGVRVAGFFRSLWALCYLRCGSRRCMGRTVCCG
jgi:hypothetical protein